MSRFHSYITSASQIISTYRAGKPLHIHIKSFFATDKKFGSRDRRTISALCYYYYRTGKAFDKNNYEKKMLSGLFLCEHANNDLLDALRPDLNKDIHLSREEKLSLLHITEQDIFPFVSELSNDINKKNFSQSFLQQPNTYLRIRPGRRKKTIEKLEEASVTFELLGHDCIKLPANTAADKILKLDKDAVVQDMNSQKVLNYLDEGSFTEEKTNAWDCCAASGGKSILLYDKLKGNVKLIVSDIRESILVNLQKRFRQAGISLDKNFIADLATASGLPLTERFSIIICDAPCTGSGTWDRNPEQLFSFDTKMIDEYASRQQRIISNTIPHLGKDGLFFYITCSVFKKENEDNVNYIKEKFHLQLMQMEYLKGYEEAADTMFVAVFKNG